MRFLFATIGLLASSALADEMPKGFHDHLLPLLTPHGVVEQLPTGPNGVAGEKPDCDFLLGESIYRAEATGVTLVVRRILVKPLTEDGIDYARERSTTFRKDDQRAWLASGITIHPDRGEIGVPEDAIFTENASSESADVHSDRERIKAIFPDVVVGSTVDAVFARETHHPTFPNEFSLYQPIGHISPMRRQRIVADLPAEMAQRLRWHVVGARKIDDPKRTEADGRVQFEWIIDRIAPLVTEDDAPRLHQRGPYITMTTMPNWNAFGRWFADFLKTPEGDEHRELKSIADEWGGESVGDDKRTIATALYEKVRDEIRYTGLEFGKGAFCPRAPNAVLDAKFGDCKDKANLLRVLLAERGIDSRIALVSTEHAGHIEKALPSVRCFNHAILAVDLGSRAPVFCDPTLVGVPFGILSPGGADRETLLIDLEGNFEWVHTPPQKSAKSEVTIDLALEPGGGFSGWIDYTARGFLGGRIHSILSSGERPRVLRFLSSLGGAMGADAIDYEVVSWDRVSGDLHFKYYVLKVGAPLAEAGKRERVSFPSMSMIFPQAGDHRRRQTPLFRIENEGRVDASFTLPENWVVIDRPEKFSGKTAGYSFEADWKEDDDKLTCTVNFKQSGSLVPVVEHADLWDLKERLMDWVISPTLCKRTPSEEDAYNDDPWRPAAEDLPDLPTPEGHVKLINARYPLDMNNLLLGDYSARRIAFERMAESFPDNAAAQFDAGISAIYCDVLDLEFDGVAARTEKLVKRWRPFLSPEKIAVAELGLAGTLTVEERFDEALPVALRLQQDEGANMTLRQAAAGLAAAAHFQLGETEAALEMAAIGMQLELIPPESTYSLCYVQLHGALKLASDKTKKEQLEKMWDKITNQRPELIDSMRETFLELPEYLLELGHHQDAAAALVALKKVVGDDAGAWGEDTDESLIRVGESLQSAERARPFVERLQAWLEQHPWPELEKLEQEDVFETALDLEFLADDYYEQPEISSRYHIRSLVECGPQAEFFESIANLAESLNDWFDSCAEDDETPTPPAMTESLIDLLLELRRESLEASELADGDYRILEAQVLMRRDGEAPGLAALETIAGDENCSLGTRCSAIEEIAFIHMWNEEYVKLLQTTAQLDSPELVEHSLSHQFLVHDAYLALVLGRMKDAWQRFERIAATDPEEFGYRLPEKLHAIIKAQVGSLSAADSNAAAAFEKIGEPEWLPAWRQLSKELGLPEDTPDQITFAIDEGMLDPATELTEMIASGEEDEYIDGFVRAAVMLARWHPALRPDVAKMLRGPARKHWPEEKKKLKAIATSIGR